MDGEKPYVYQPLEDPNSTIRLINILSITPDICCKLRVVSLENKPVFSALSYMWGDTTEQETVVVDGRPTSVTTNLAHALRDVFGQWSNGCHTAPGETQWLWADAICINQDDKDEKNHQVPLMGKIYSGAHQVFSWLGADEKVVRGGIDAVEMVSRAISKLPCYTLILDISKDGSDLIAPRYRFSRPLGPGDLEINWLEIYPKVQHISACHGVFNQVDRLLRLPYWRQLWIFQELVLARSLIFLSGSRTTTWQRLCSLLIWVQLFRIRCSEFRRPEAMPVRDWGLLMHFLYTRYCLFVTLGKTGRSQGLLNTDRPVVHGHTKLDVPDFHTGMHIINSYGLLRLAVTFQATDPKDYVYAMGGITGIHIQTDYSSGKSVAQVYQDFVAGWLLVLAKNSWTNEKIMYDLWFLELSGIGSTLNQIPTLPSWAPNFVSTAERGGAKSLVGTYKRSRDLLPDDPALPTLDGSALCCKAAFVDHISELSPLTENSEEAGMGSDISRLWLFDYVSKLSDSVATRVSVISDVAPVMFCRDKPMSNEVFDLFLQLLIVDL
jgi:hypothetical protein